MKNKNLKLSLALLTVLGLSACGSTTATSGVSANSSTSSSGTPSTSSGNIYNLPVAPTYNAEINGAGGAVPEVSYEVSTSRTLVVKVTPLAAPNLTLAGYTNFVFPYGCLQLQVTVNGQTQTTSILQVDGVSQGPTSPCANSPTYQNLNFDNDVNGSGSAAVTISNAVYDNCRETNPLNYGCQMSAIFQTHIVAATIQIQTDGTYMSP